MEFRRVLFRSVITIPTALYFLAAELIAGVGTISVENLTGIPDSANTQAACLANFSLRKRGSYPITTPFRLTLQASIHLMTACETIFTLANVNCSEERRVV